MNLYPAIILWPEEFARLLENGACSNTIDIFRDRFYFYFVKSSGRNKTVNNEPENVEMTFFYIDLQKPDFIIKIGQLEFKKKEYDTLRVVINSDEAFLYVQVNRQSGQILEIYELNMNASEWLKFSTQFHTHEDFLFEVYEFKTKLYCNESGLFLQYDTQDMVPYSSENNTLYSLEPVCEYAVVTLNKENQQINLKKIAIPLPIFPIDNLQLVNKDIMRTLYRSLHETSNALKIDADPFKCEIIAMAHRVPQLYSKLFVMKDCEWHFYKCETIEQLNEIDRIGIFERTSINNNVISMSDYENFYEIAIDHNEKSWKINRQDHHQDFWDAKFCTDKMTKIWISRKGIEIYRNQPHNLTQICCGKLRPLLGYKEDHGYIWHSDEGIKMLIKKIKSFYL